MNSNDNELLVGRDDILAALIAGDEGQLFDNIYRLCWEGPNLSGLPYYGAQATLPPLRRIVKPGGGPWCCVGTPLRKQNASSLRLGRFLLNRLKALPRVAGERAPQWPMPALPWRA